MMNRLGYAGGWQFWLVGLVYFSCWVEYSAEEQPTCKPQGLLQLDPPYPPPYKVSLPFCDQYTCSCCNVSHALAVGRHMGPVLLDDELSRSCKRRLMILACSICDPEVGVGNVTTVCQHTCQQAYDDCIEEFFSYNPSSGLVSPCVSQDAVHLVCSQLSELVKDGQHFCKALGHEPAADSSSSTCFDGQPRPQPTCASPPRRNKLDTVLRTSERSSRPAKSRRGLPARLQRLQFWPFATLSWQQRKQVQEAGQLAFAMLVTSGVALGVIAGLQLFMQGKRRGRGRVLGRS